MTLLRIIPCLNLFSWNVANIYSHRGGILFTIWIVSVVAGINLSIGLICIVLYFTVHITFWFKWPVFIKPQNLNWKLIYLPSNQGFCYIICALNVKLSSILAHSAKNDISTYLLHSQISQFCFKRWIVML